MGVDVRASVSWSWSWRGGRRFGRRRRHSRQAHVQAHETPGLGAHKAGRVVGAGGACEGKGRRPGGGHWSVESGGLAAAVSRARAVGSVRPAGEREREEDGERAFG